MAEHLNRERISALLEDPRNVRGGLEHVAECEQCAHEYEQMSRMRMALSGLPDLESPEGEWDRIQEKLGLEPLREATVSPIWRKAARWPLQAAAVVALFAAGLVVGQRIGAGDDGAQDAATVADARNGGVKALMDATSESLLASEPAEAYLRTVADLQQLRDGEANAWEAGPAAVAERITRLDAMIDASRDALREAPADPVLNNFLFQLVDEREDLAGQLDQTLRMTAAEY